MGRILLAAGFIACALTASASQGSGLTFHHLHLNGTGMQDFYVRLFDPATTSTEPVAGFAALRSGPMLMLFGHPQLATDKTPIVEP